MLERYVLWFESMNINAKGDVMCEWRGKQPNRKLEDAYARLYKFGTDNVSAARFQKRLSSGSLKIKTKAAKVAGLQLADLLASPVCRSLICLKQKTAMTAPFGKAVVKILLNGKFRRGGQSRKSKGLCLYRFRFPLHYTMHLIAVRR
jgi:hypothetical protein